MRKVAVIILAVIAVLTAAPASANSRWSNNEVPIYVGPRLGPGWNVDAVIAEWNKGPVTLVRVYEPCVDCINVRLVKPKEPVDWAGLAWVWTNESTINKCVIHVDGNKAWRHSRSNILAHEIGHCLGLPHNNLRWSVMAEHSSVHPSDRPLPLPHDLNNLWAGYL